MLLGIERRARAIVPEDDIGVDLGIKIGDANLVADDGVFKTRLRLSITTAAASTVVTSAALLAIAINVHVDELFPVTVQVNHAGCCICTVSERFICRCFSRSRFVRKIETLEAWMLYLCCHHLCCGNLLVVRSGNDPEL